MRRIIKALILTLMFYLLQVCAMQYLKIGGVTGSLPAVVIAILTVSYGKKYAFGASCLLGILLEAMTASVGGLYAVIYPVLSMVFAQAFADMSDEKREKRLLRLVNGKKFKGDLNPHLRILLDASCISAGMEMIFLLYVTLSGADLTFRLILRAFGTVLYTAFLAALLMVPARLFLGMYSGRVRRAMIEERG